MRTHALRPASVAARGTDTLESAVLRSETPQASSEPTLAARLGHRFEDLAVARVDGGEGETDRSAPGILGRGPAIGYRPASPVLQRRRRTKSDPGPRRPGGLNLLGPPNFGGLVHQPPLHQQIQQPLAQLDPQVQPLPNDPQPLPQLDPQVQPLPNDPQPLPQVDPQVQPLPNDPQPPQQQNPLLQPPLLPPQQNHNPPPQQGGSGLSDFANFVAINSPGTQTGAVGGLAGVNSLLSPPSQLPGVTGSRYSAMTGKATTGIGAGLNMLSGASDLVATGQSLNSMRQEGGVGGFFRGMWDTISRPFSRNKQQNETGKQAETRSTAKRLAVDLPVNLADASSQGMQAANAISSLTHAGTSILPSVTGVASAGIGAGVQGVVAGRAAWRMGRAWHHKRAVDRVRQGFGRRNDVHPEMSAAANHMSTQLNKRRGRNIIGGLGAAAGAAGGGLLLAGLLGGAAMLTPIGWALAGAGALTAAGLGAYKLYRHFKKKKENRLGTERQTHADNLHRAVTNPIDVQHRLDALAILKSHGVTESQARDPDKGQQLIRRKLEGW